MNKELNKVLYFDTETTGLPPKGAKWETDYNDFPHIVQIAWYIGNVAHNYIIRPNGYEIPDEVAAIHGITTARAMEEGVTFEEAMQSFFTDALNAPYIAAHNIHFDTSVIKANMLRHIEEGNAMRIDFDTIVVPALDKEKRIDTMKKTIKFVGALKKDGTPGKFPRLEELYAKLFNGETFPAHDALEDVLAVRRCLPELVKLGIIEIGENKPAEAETESKGINVPPTAENATESKNEKINLLNDDIEL